MASPRCEALGGVCTGGFYCEYAGCAAAAPAREGDFEGSAAQQEQIIGHYNAHERTGRRRLRSGQMNKSRRRRPRTNG